MTRKNPLDPNAWLTEGHRFDIPGETADIRLGVHAADSFETALAYAVHKASQEGDLPGGEFNCGIVFELDVRGLEPLPEADAIVESEHEDVVVGALLESIGGAEAIRTASSDDLSKLVLEFVELSKESDFDADDIIDEWFYFYWAENVRSSGVWSILSPLERLAEEDPEDLKRVLEDMTHTGGFPLELWAEAIGQYRYMESIGFGRLLRVYAVHPVHPELLSSWDDESGYSNGPLIFMEGEPLMPDTKLLWDSGKKGAVVEYHGTDISRARSAFPEIADIIVNPWPFGQPEGVGPT